MKKNKRKTKKVICNICKNEFYKTLSEIKRTEKRNGNHYCSLKCAGQNAKKNLGEHLGKGDVNRFKTIKRSDKYTGFREFLRRARNRKKLGDLSLDDIRNQWIKQDGICPYTGIKLKLRMGNEKNKIPLFELASLDRINSNGLYEKDNIVFVSTPINYMKGSMTEIKTIEFCKIITNFWKDK